MQTMLIMLAKMFCILLSLIKSSKTYVSICCDICIYFFYFILSFFDLKYLLKILNKNTFSSVSRGKSMFCEHYFLPQVKNTWSIKRYFHTFFFQDCFVFHLIRLLLKGFLVLSDLLKPPFEKK